MEKMTLRRKLFGYSLEDVSQLFADRERMFAQANQRAQAAEEQLAEVQAKLQPVNDQMELKDREIASLERLVAELSGQVESMQSQSIELQELRQQVIEWKSDPLAQLLGGDVTIKFLISEVAPVLKAAEESAVTMLEEAQSQSRKRLEETERASQEVQRQVNWLITWRQQIEPLIRAVQERIGETRQRIEEIPDRIRQALMPVADSMTTATAELGQLVESSAPPAMSEPQWIEQAEWRDWGPRAAAAETPQPEAAVAVEEDAVYIDAAEPAWWAT
jgi:chromosome segregation ATPase